MRANLAEALGSDYSLVAEALVGIDARHVAVCRRTLTGSYCKNLPSGASSGTINRTPPEEKSGSNTGASEPSGSESRTQYKKIDIIIRAIYSVGSVSFTDYLPCAEEGERQRRRQRGKSLMVALVAGTLVVGVQLRLSFFA